MVTTSMGTMGRCPVCATKIKEFDEMSKNLIHVIDQVLVDKEPEEKIDKRKKDISKKHDKPLKWKKGNGKGKEDY
jgi:hypothetical protein